jgi:hypothetical protein
MNWIQKNNNTNIKVKYNKRPKTQDNKNSNKYTKYKIKFYNIESDI